MSERRFKECVTEKNVIVIHYDILQSMRNIYDAVKNDAIKGKVLELIESKMDLKYRKKYASVWRGI